MSVIRNIDGIPLFSTVSEALAWGMAKGLTGYHTHGDGIDTEMGYMGGATHQQTTTQPFANTNTNTNTNTTSNTTTNTSGSSGSVGY